MMLFLVALLDVGLFIFGLLLAFACFGGAWHSEDWFYLLGISLLLAAQQLLYRWHSSRPLKSYRPGVMLTYSALQCLVPFISCAATYAMIIIEERSWSGGAVTYYFPATASYVVAGCYLFVVLTIVAHLRWLKKK